MSLIKPLMLLLCVSSASQLEVAQHASLASDEKVGGL